MPADDERRLHRAVLAGDERAWRALYDASFAGLDAYVLWRCAGLRDRADDVVQETWLTAVRRIADLWKIRFGASGQPLRRREWAVPRFCRSNTGRARGPFPSAGIRGDGQQSGESRTGT